MQRPWGTTNLGWLIAVIVLILAVLSGLGGVAVPAWILIALLAVAILV
jgi:hypothetical protein